MMRTKLLLSGMVLFVLLSWGFVVSVDADSSTWSKTYGGAGNDIAYSLIVTSDGGYALAGTTNSSDSENYYDFLLVKTDADGNMLWNMTYGEPDYDCAESLVETSDGGYALVGSDVLVKTDAFGNMEWNKTDMDGSFWSLVESSDGGYILAGHIQLSDDWLGNGTGYDFCLVKTDEFGNMEWRRIYGGRYGDHAYSLVNASDGGYALAGSTDSFGAGSYDFWLIKTDSSGNMQWNKTYGGPDTDGASSLVATPDGGYAILGGTDSFGAGDSNFWLIKTDADGNMQWNKTYGGKKYESANDLVATSDGGYAFVCSGTGDCLLVKTDATGTMEWNQTYGGPAYDNAYSLVATSDGGYAIAGSTYSFGAGGYDFWLIKTDENGCVPEYSSWLLPSILTVAALVIVVYKKKLLKSRTSEN